jgi:hypothetical protein
MRRWEDNIKIDFEAVEWRGVDWIDLAQDRDRWRAFVNAVMNIRVPQNAGNFLTSFSGRTLLDGVGVQIACGTQLVSSRTQDVKWGVAWS